jgi:hypothetical protein
MGSHPINLALRFVLELAAWGSMGYWGWTQHDGIVRLVMGIGLPVLAMALWGTFRVPGDPKDAPVAVPGGLRLLLELAEFGLAMGLLAAAGRDQWAIILGVIVTLHYVVSYDRIAWLLKQR